MFEQQSRLHRVPNTAFNTSNLSKAHEMCDSFSSSYSQTCLDLSLSILMQFTPEIYAAATNCKKNH